MSSVPGMTHHLEWQNHWLELRVKHNILRHQIPPLCKNPMPDTLRCGMGSFAVFGESDTDKTKKTAYKKLSFLVRVVIQNFLKTIVVQFVFEVIG